MAEGESLAQQVGRALGEDVYVEYQPYHPGWSGRWPFPHEASVLRVQPRGPPLPPPPPAPGPEVLTAV